MEGTNNYISEFSGTPMLTTIDNPYHPSKQFEQWFLYDCEKGYNSCGLLARFAHTSDALSNEENDLELSRAIDEIMRLDFRGIFRKVYAE